MIKTIDFLFITLVTSLVISASHYLTLQFYAVPISIGFTVCCFVLLNGKVKFDGVLLFFVLLLFAVFFRGVINGVLFSFDSLKSIVLILYNYGLVRYFSEYEPKPIAIQFVLAVLFIWLLYFILGRLAGYNSLTLSAILFSGGSYHIIAWFGLFFVSFVVFFCSQQIYIWISIVLYLLLCLLLGGRSGVFISIFIFSIYLFFRQGYKISIAKLTVLLVILSVFSTLAFNFSDLLSQDVQERGVGLGPREIIWYCYFDHMSLNNFLWGFDKEELFSCTAPILGRAALESSFFSLQVYTGFISVFLLLLLLVKVLSVAKLGALKLSIIASYIFRVSTGEFIFITPFDWFFLILLFRQPRR